MIGSRSEGAMEKSKPASGSVTIAFLVLLGAVLAFVIGQRVGTTLDHQGHSITVAPTVTSHFAVAKREEPRQ